MAKGRIDEAERILADLEGTDVEDPYIITQSKDIQWAVQYEKDHAVRWRDLLRGRTGDQAGTHTIRRVILGMGTQAMQQLSGINVTSYYLPTVLIESVGLSNTLARLLAACNSVSYLLFSLIGIPNVERWGRRKMMMYAAAGQFFCYCIITICIRYNEDTSLSPSTNQQWAKGSIAFFFLYYVFFGIGWQGVPWVRFLLPKIKASCLLRSAVPNRDQLNGDANKGRCIGNSDQLVSYKNVQMCTNWLTTSKDI